MSLSLDSLQEMAERANAEKIAERAITKSRVSMILGKSPKAVWFSRLLLRLECKADWTVDTAATDGTVIIYNPGFINALSDNECIGVMCHEVMHCALKHHTRRGKRSPSTWNIACDIVINDVMRSASFVLPSDALYPEQFSRYGITGDMTPEAIYELLQKDSGDNGEPTPDPGRCGGVMDAGTHGKPDGTVGSPADMASSDNNWSEAVMDASIAAKQRGNLPGKLDQFSITDIRSEPSWKDVLADFISHHTYNKDDYSWKRPNKRFMYTGVYLPSLRSPSLGHVVLAIDVSGSVFDVLHTFTKELNGILECSPCRLTIVYADAAVQAVDEWTPGAGPVSLRKVGGGGTSHACVWRFVRGLDADPECVVCLTDGYTDFSIPPDVPILWAMTSGSDAKPPFGRVCRVVKD